MARHSLSADRAFELLRDHSQRNGRKLSDVAAAVVESHLLLVPPPPRPSGVIDGDGSTSASSQDRGAALNEPE
jgi:hypothetical protein